MTRTLLIVQDLSLKIDLKCLMMKKVHTIVMTLVVIVLSNRN